MAQRTAFVTGASRGIGRACALQLAAAGYRVALGARNRELLEQVAQEIRAAGGEAFAVTIDLGSQESIKEAMATVAKEFGVITVLINNAGITRDGLSMRMKREDWDAVLNTNLSGAFFCCQQAMPGMMKERWGRIINIASVVGQMGNAGQANYVAAKAGLSGVTKTLAQELGSRNITVNCVTPGFVDTDMTAVLPDEVKEKMLGVIPLKRFGKAEDIAAAVKFLASDEAGYVTGAVLNVNGGMYM
ncbi:MAG: 3-oxoacyl-[acyl-carrier-protein] reductase [Acidobacteria bacterium]|nr:3-oxoacyl-[acyl-carrier-protein] reductase [Acidobacteriota bacterium]